MSDTNVPLAGEMRALTGDVLYLRNRMRELPVGGYFTLEDGVTFLFRFRPGPPDITYKFLWGSEIRRLRSLVPQVRRYVVSSNDGDYSIRIDESVKGSGGDFWFMGMPDSDV